MGKKTVTSTPTGFGKHPSKKLQEVFKRRPYQIQCPEKAKIIFLGLDANWNKEIKTEFFKETRNYLEDGVKYWKDNGIHTPMLKEIYKWDGKRYLKNTYKGGGKRYHTQFCKLGFLPKDAEKICFLELLNVCTYGSSTKNMKKFRELLNENHLNWIRKIFELDNFICISKTAKEIINELGGFNRTKNIKVHYHFSYRKITDKDIEDIRLELWKYLGKK